MKLTTVKLMLIAGFFYGHVYGQVTITPQAGINVSFLTNELTEISHSASVGFQFGVDFRFGGFLHFQPGIFWQRSETELTYTAVDLKDDVNFDMINIPLLVGIKPIPLKILDLRIYAGPSINIVTNVGDNILGLTKDNYSDVIWGLIMGAGLDFIILSVNLSYEFGLSNIFDFSSQDLEEILSSKSDVFRLNIGLRL